MVRLEFGAWGKATTGVKPLLFRHIQGTGLLTVDIDREHGAEAVSVGFPHSKVTISPVLGQKSLHAAHT